MKTQAFRVREVRVGHSPAAAILGEDAQGRELRLEVGALEGASIRPGDLLVLSWATVMVPEKTEENPALVGGLASEVDGRAVEDVEIEPRDARSPGDEADREFRSMMGLD
jgi:hypothetical protein